MSVRRDTTSTNTLAGCMLSLVANENLFLVQHQLMNPRYQERYQGGA